jgi:hypothetical protein
VSGVAPDLSPFLVRFQLWGQGIFGKWAAKACRHAIEIAYAMGK